MYSAGQSGELADSNAYGGESPTSRMMPRGTHTTDEELVFRNDSSRSKSSQNHSYMASISTGQKARSTMSASTSRVGPHSANSSSTNISQQASQRSTSSTGHYPNGGGSSPGNSARSSAVRLPARASPGASEGAGKRRPAAQQGHQRKVSIDARGYLRALNDLFFAKFCVDELFYREFRELLVKRIQDSTYRYDPEDLQDILDDLTEACKSTRLNLDAVSQWRLNYFTRDQSASVIDHIFLINVNVMVYDAKYSNACLDTYCADPLCSEIHAGRVTEEDKAKAFRRVLNILLNEALRVRLITKEQKTSVRMRLVKGVYAAEDRINAIKELAVLTMLAQDERLRDLVTYALVGVGKPWSQADMSATDVDEDCNLDPDMVYRKAMSTINNQYLESILDVRRLGMSISVEEVGRLRDLWARASTRVPDARVVTLPMLLHLLVHCSESELQGALPQAGVSGAAMAKAGEAGGLCGRIEQVEDAALQIVQNLGLAWELGDNPPRDLRQFCMVLLLDLGSLLSMLLVPEGATPGSSDTMAADSDAREVGVVEDGLFAKWWDVCEAVVRFERVHRRFYAAFLVTYIKISSEKLLAQKADFDPELFLSMVVELLTEYRKRRPDYEAIVLTLDGHLSLLSTGSDSTRSSGSGDSVNQKKPIPPPQPGGKVLDRRTREDIGSEFDRLFAWVDQQLPSNNRVRSLSRAPSPRGRTPSWQTTGGSGSIGPAGMDKMRSSSSASIGYNSSSGGNRVASPLPPMPASALSREHF
ncbi:hypothetical protein GGH94_001453 [Coemansia aciculifera]|uniref:Uncharacterized protein n=1 Tax=Coemansia aciculifera TaxID=417176 RepID=A0A9W8M4Y2_9FUNG|nr:hypothetical protein GGH94_001453 [Coemansia aciculifera]